MRITLDDLLVVLVYCVLAPLVGVGAFLALLPVYVGVAVWVLRLCGVA